MNLNTIVNLLQGGVIQVLKLSLPVLGGTLIIGLLISIFQAVTSIQEQSMTFLPKLVVTLLILVLLGSWMFSSMGTYTINLFKLIPEMAK